jgi:hypothetical protein
VNAWHLLSEGAEVGDVSVHGTRRRTCACSMLGPVLRSATRNGSAPMGAARANERAAVKLRMWDISALPWIGYPE